MNVKTCYKKLMEHYGPQGWWPIDGTYHRSDYSYPRSVEELFEICVGAILTQNSSWRQVEVALTNLRGLVAFDPEELLLLKDDKLKTAIKPSGYFNQKAKKLKLFAAAFLKFEDEIPSRDELLAIWGVGPETADSILLYGYGIPIMVIDSYTKRLFHSLEFIDSKASYQDVQDLCMNELPLDTIMFQEFHALIVHHCKQFYSKRPYGLGCFL